MQRQYRRSIPWRMPHYCPKVSEHSTINTSKEDLIIFTVIQEL